MRPLMHEQCCGFVEYKGIFGKCEKCGTEGFYTIECTDERYIYVTFIQTTTAPFEVRFSLYFVLLTFAHYGNINRHPRGVTQ